MPWNHACRVVSPGTLMWVMERPELRQRRRHLNVVFIIATVTSAFLIGLYPDRIASWAAADPISASLAGVCVALGVLIARECALRYLYQGEPPVDLAELIASRSQRRPLAAVNLRSLRAPRGGGIITRGREPQELVDWDAEFTRLLDGELDNN